MKQFCDNNLCEYCKEHCPEDNRYHFLGKTWHKKCLRKTKRQAMQSI